MVTNTQGLDAAGLTPALGGTVTFLLTDMEGSTSLWEGHPQAMAGVIARHYELLGQAVERHHGVRPSQQGEGDSMLAAFPRASDALACALAIQIALHKEPWSEGIELRVRLALHSGSADATFEGTYFGGAVNRCARLRDIAHGGQILLSGSTHELVVDSLGKDASLKDLGRHRLKDLTRPEHVYQLCHPALLEDFPPLRSLNVLPNNLPVRLTSFVGREAEIDQVSRLLGQTRLLTLTGSGGCGKTRLAHQIGAEVLDSYEDGVWWVDLAPRSDPESVPNAIAETLAIKEVPFQPILESVRDSLSQKRLLLILDNCEHLIAACSGLAESLLTSCPELVILATSREPLGVEGETAWRVPSLTLPAEDGSLQMERLTQCEAVRLFIDRALRTRPNFSVNNDNAPSLAEICHRLDGIPLAIELAAARTRVLTPEQILTGLEDRFRLLTGGARSALPRQQTLEASVEWSHTLLSDKERTMLQRLGVFAGRFTLDAAEFVCGSNGIESAEVLDLLSSLVDKSMVQMEEREGIGTYRLLETIRHYALRHLGQSDEAARIRDRHLDFYAALSEQAEQGLVGPDFLVWVERLDAEIDNLRAALQWGESSGRLEQSFRMGGALGFYWYIRGQWSEGRSHVESAASVEDASLFARASALNTASFLSLWLMDLGPMRTFGEQALAIGREIGADEIVRSALQAIGWATFMTEPDITRAYLSESAELCDSAGDDFGYVNSLCGVGLADSLKGRTKEARQTLEEALAVAERTRHPWLLQEALVYLAFTVMLTNDFARADEHLRRAHDLAVSLRDPGYIALSLNFRGAIKMFTGEYVAARGLLDEASQRATSSGNLFAAFNSLYFSAWLDFTIGDLASARETNERAAAMGRSFGLTWLAAGCVVSLARTCVVQQDYKQAAPLLEEAEELCNTSSNKWHLAEVWHWKGVLRQLRGDHRAAEDLYHDALKSFVEIGDGAFACVMLEELANIAAANESFIEAARLVGAAGSHRAHIGYPVEPIHQSRLHDSLMATLRDQLDEERLQSATDDGATLSLDDAIAYATRARGERKRPSTGWASLTPMEFEVTKLVAEGLTNPQIGERLFISRRTVQAHLSHVFAKLNISTRSELAAEASRRGM